MEIRITRKTFLLNYVFALIFVLLSLAFLNNLLVFSILFSIFLFLILEPEIARISTKFKIEKNKIIEIKGIFSRSEKIIDFEKITEIYMHQNPLDRILNIGEIIVKSFDDKIKMKKIDNPNKIKKLLEKRLKS